ncbi:MAG: HU family DNA-binding protein [Bacteroidales bacterium]|nr:HU family DNA-binding protein [Bacteroidales bacterium]
MALHTGDSRKQSEDFIKEFFGAISAALANGEQVKIKDFGVFKTTLVGARKSVNVSTGEDHEIPAHYKVSFTPSKEIAAIINEPFEMFETVELNDNVSLDDLETIDQADPDDAPDQPIPESEQPEPEPNHSEQPEADNSPLYVFDDSDSDLSKPSDDDNKSSDDQDASSDDEKTSSIEDKILSISETISTDSNGIVHVSEKIKFVPDHDGFVCEDFSPVDEETSPVDEDSSSVDEENYPKPAKGRFWLGFLVGFAAAFFVAFIIYGTFLYIGDSQSLHTNQVQTPSAVTADAKSSADPATDQSVAAQKANQSAESDQPEVEQKATDTPEVNTRPSDSPLYDTITKTRYLTTMAKDHYGNYHLWPYIYMENQKFLGHPDRITPGTKVVVPPLSKYGVDPSNPEHIKKAKQLGIEIYKKYQ